MSEKRGSNKYEEMELRRGPWTLEEDTLLIHYIACHGEGRWNLLAKCSGLKRTGKSCRLRWLNYLKPDIKRGNLSPEEQFLILELHSKWGNRWSRIAQHLPGRTDNEIKNYWRTRVQKQARQLKIDANSAMFRDALRCSWMPRLLEKMGSSQSMPSLIDANATSTTAGMIGQTPHDGRPPQQFSNPAMQYPFENCSAYEPSGSENHSPSTSSGSMTLPQLPYLSEFSSSPANSCNVLAFNPFMSGHCIDHSGYGVDTVDLAPASASHLGSSVSDHTMAYNNCVDSIGDGLWNMDELWYVCSRKAT